MADETLAPEVTLLARDVGTWDAEITVHPGAGAPPIASRGVSTQRMVGGRWLVADFKNETGFEGHGIYGWDPDRKAYVGTWVDTMRGFLTVGAGHHDPERKTMTYTFEAKMGGRNVRWREETETTGDDTRVFRQFFPGGEGGDVQTMSVKYTRRVSA